MTGNIWKLFTNVPILHQRPDSPPRTMPTISTRSGVISKMISGKICLIPIISSGTADNGFCGRPPAYSVKLSWPSLFHIWDKYEIHYRKFLFDIYLFPMRQVGADQIFHEVFHGRRFWLYRRTSFRIAGFVRRSRLPKSHST